MYVIHKFHLSEYHKDYLQDLEPPFGYNGFGEFLFYRTYSRNINGRQENWADCVIRVIEGIMSIRKDWYIKNHISWDEKYWQNIAFDMGCSLSHMYWSPPGRGLWAMGTDFIYERGGMALYNCAATDIVKDFSEDMCWTMDSLMLGVGVGFSPLRTDDIKFKNPKGTYEFVIPDSREGWVDSKRALYAAYWYGSPKPHFIYDEIRREGELINGFGGFASGPAPLKLLHEQFEELVEKYETDKYYDSVMLKTDTVNQIGCCVVAGNVRRSAELGSLSIKDKVFKNLKDYDKYPYRKPWGWMSNNSVDLEHDEDFEMLDDIAERVVVRGEPGYKNLRNFPKGRIGKKPLKKDKARNMNPCTSSDTLVITKNGLKRVKDLINRQFITYINGIPYKSTEDGFFSSGEKELFELETKEGYKIRCTADHEILAGSENFSILTPLKYLKPGSIVYLNNHSNIEWDGYGDWNEGYLIGSLYGDGCVYKENKGRISLWENDHDNIQFVLSMLDDYRTHRHEETNKFDIYSKQVDALIIEFDVTPEKIINDEILSASKEFQAGFLSAFFDCDGSIQGSKKSGYTIRLNQSDIPRLEAVQQILINFGIFSRIYKERYKATRKLMPDGKGGKKEYYCKANHDLIISQGGINTFYNEIGFSLMRKNNIVKDVLSTQFNSQKFQGIVESIKSIGIHEVYDCQIPGINLFPGNGLILRNCGEICLEGGSFNGQRVREVCNVDETFPTMCPDIHTWYKACEYATLYASTVSLLPTHQPSTNRVVARNRRIGVSIVDFTGWIEAEGVSMVTKYLRKGYKIVRKTNKIYNGEAGVPESIRVTTVKPGGTVPKVAGKTSGAGYPNFHTMIRRVRVARGTQLHGMLAEAGLMYEADYNSANTDVFEWPIRMGPAPPAEEISVWQQAMNLVLLQREWADNAVSNTLNFRPKWKLTKCFKIINGCNNPFEATKKWLTKGNIDTYHKFMDDFASLKDEIIHDNIRILVSRNEQLKTEEINIYIYDPTHEEDSIRPLLSAIAPLTKSVALMPHSAKGAYPQMPEEGISEAEYERRIKGIRKIDWSLLFNSNGIDEKFCDGDQCELLQ